MRYITIFFLFLLFCAEISGQYRYDPIRGSSVKAKNSYLGELFPFGYRGQNTAVKYKFQYIQGVILPHSDRVKPLVDDYVRGGEFAVEFPRYGGEDWYFYYNFPTTAWGLLFLDLGNTDKLGYVAAFYPYINLPLLHFQRFSFNIKMGAGLAYITEKYDPKKPDDFAENNFAIGSHLNGFLALGANLECLVLKKAGISLTADGALNHFSNGSVQKPNAGLNIFNVSAGVKYTPHLAPSFMRYKSPKKKKDWEFDFSLAGGANQQNVTDPRKYLNMSLMAGGYCPLTKRYRLGVNIDVFYNNAFFAERKLPEYYAGENEKIRAGFSLANQLMFGDLTVGLHAGVYVFNRISHDGFSYFKLAAKYRVYDRIFVMAAVKTHREVAEFCELGVGYTLASREKTPYSWLPEKEKKQNAEKPPLKYRIKNMFKRKNKKR